MAKDSRAKVYKSGRIRLDNEAQILRSAEQEFAEHGFQGASINSIAKRAGIPRTTVLFSARSTTACAGVATMCSASSEERGYPL